MSDSTTYILLAAAVLTAGGIYMFNPNAKAARHSQPKFTQMNKPGDYFKPPSSSTENSDNSTFKAKNDLGQIFPSGKTFLG